MSKERIIDLFNSNVKGKIPQLNGVNLRHAGRIGHWLETQMGIQHNGDNAPDLYGYEMKNKTTSGKITFGDWSATKYIFISDSNINEINNEFQFSREDFLKTFGKPNIEKNNRFSWSGTPCPTYYGDITPFGQKLTMDENDNVVILYSYSADERANKARLIPISMQRENLILAKWDKEMLRTKLENKFNQAGWFTCTTNENGEYANIHFGAPMNYTSWIELFRNRIVFFDSGMYETNIRPYSMWRASTGFWHSLIIDSY